MFVYLPDINLAGDKIVLMDKDVNTLFTKSSSVNIHLIFHGYQSGIVSKFTPFFKRLRQNVPMGTFGTIFNEQKVVVNMITAQRVYQANAQTVWTHDQLLQTIVNLR